MIAFRMCCGYKAVNQIMQTCPELRRVLFRFERPFLPWPCRRPQGTAWTVWWWCFPSWSWLFHLAALVEGWAYCEGKKWRWRWRVRVRVRVSIRGQRLGLGLGLGLEFGLGLGLDVRVSVWVRVGVSVSVRMRNICQRWTCFEARARVRLGMEIKARVRVRVRVRARWGLELGWG